MSKCALPTLVAALALLFLAGSAGASLILATPDQTNGTGLGAVNTVLTMQDDPTESGCVAWDGSSDVVGPAACPAGIAGGDETAINMTRTIGELGLTSAFNVRVVFNYNEDVDDNITLDELVLTIYDATTGTVLFTSGAFDPDTFMEPFSGTGNAGFVYRLDTEQAAQAQPHFADPANRIGLAAAASQTAAGPETFFVADASDVFPADADLEVTKTDSADPVAIGATYSYVVTVTNNGPNNATGVEIVDALPSPVAFQSASAGCVAVGDVVTCDVGDLAVGEMASVTITVTAPGSNREVTNTATVSGDQNDPDTSNNSASEETTIGIGGTSSADVSVRKSDSPDPVPTGGTLTYTLVVENSGPDTANSVIVNDVLPKGTSFVSASMGCSHSDGVVTCVFASIADGASETVTIVVTAPASEGTITNSASVSSDESDPNPGNNSDSEQTQVTDAPADSADLRLTKTDSTDPVTGGNDFTYTLTVDNLGPDDANGVVVTDNLPAAVTFVSATPAACSHSGGVVTCPLGTIAAGDSGVVTITVTAPMSSTTLTNTANVSADEPDPNAANNDAVEQTTVDGGSASVANLSVVKNDSPDPVAVDGTLTYTILVSNAGPDDATNVTVVDTLPPTVTFQSASAGCAQSGQQVVCDLGTVAAGATETVMIVVTPNASGTILNSVSVSSDENDPNTANNSATERTTVGTDPAGADLAIAKTASPDPVMVGENLVYTLTVDNFGPAPATGVEVSDVLPADVSFVDADPSCSESAGTVTCDLGTLASGAMTTVTITVNVDGSGPLVNTATVSGNEADPMPDNNTATETTTVDGGPTGADLAIVKTAMPDPVTVGQNLVYMLTVDNLGPAPATGVTISDVLPAGVSFVAADPSCSEAAGTVTCDLGTLAAGAMATVTITVMVDESGTLVNTATVSGNEPDPVPGNNTDTESTTASTGPTGADLAIAKTAAPEPVTVGQALVYTLTVDNFGPANATGVTVSDVLPMGVSFVDADSSQGTCDEASGTVTCDLGTLAAGATATVMITVTVEETGTLVNVATVSGNEPDPVPGNDTDDETTAVDVNPIGIPTASEYGLMLLVLLLAASALAVMRRQALG